MALELLLPLRRSFATALTHAKTTDCHFHDLRHTFIRSSHLVMAGADLAAVKELLGLKDIKMMLRYAHLQHTRGRPLTYSTPSNTCL